MHPGHLFEVPQLHGQVVPDQGLGHRPRRPKRNHRADRDHRPARHLRPLERARGRNPRRREAEEQDGVARRQRRLAPRVRPDPRGLARRDHRPARRQVRVLRDLLRAAGDQGHQVHGRRYHRPQQHHSDRRGSPKPATTARHRWTAAACGATTSNPEVENPLLMERSSSKGPGGDPAPVGEGDHVSKSFGETKALVDVSLDVMPGECHGLVGRNGAGKSTLVSLLTGLSRPDRGSVRLAGQPAPGLADRGAWLARVACVYQRSMVVPPLTVAENVFLNRPTATNTALVNWRTMRDRAHDLMLDWGFDLDVDQEAARLTVEQRQIVEIARALSIGARLLILDEPTAALEKAAVERLFEHVKRLRAGGVGVLYISHHLEEIYEICDRVTVLRDGELVLTGQVRDVPQGNLVAAMVGAAPPRRATEIEAVKRSGGLGDRRLQVDHLNVLSRAGSVSDVSLFVRGGECVGLVGLEG